MISFLKQNFRWIAGGFLLTFLSSFGQTFFISASVGEWQMAFDLSHGEFGRLYMGATLASALCLPFVGRVVDVVPEHKVILVITPILAGATLLAAYAPSAFVLTGAIFLLRLFGQGMMTHVALTATGRWFAAQRGRAVSLVVLGHQAGEASLPLAFTALALAVGFQGGWVAAALVLMGVGLPLGVWAFSKPRTPHGALPDGEGVIAGYGGYHWTRAQVIRDPIFWLLLAGVLAPGFIGTTIFFHQDYLASYFDWAPGTFASGLAVMALTTIVFALINGALIDRFSARRILPFFLFPLGIACVVLSFARDPAMVTVFMVLVGVSYGFSSTLFGALWPEVYGTRHLGSVRSLIVSASVLATAAGPGLTGTLIDAGIDLTIQMQVLGLYCFGVCFVMGVASWRLAKRRASA